MTLYGYLSSKNQFHLNNLKNKDQLQLPINIHIWTSSNIYKAYAKYK